MNKAEFFVGSLAVHVILLLIVLLMPAPFPSGRGSSETGLTYVDVKREEEGLMVKTARSEAAGRTEPRIGKGGVSRAPQARQGGMNGVGGRVVDGNAGNPGVAGGQPSGTEEVKPKPQPIPPEPSQQQPALPPTAPVQEKKQAPVKQASAKPAAEAPKPAATEPVRPGVVITASAPAAKGLRTDKPEISFKRVKGWPVPPMVRVRMETSGLPDTSGAPWHAESDADWVILSPRAGRMSDSLDIGVNASRLALGYYEGTVKVTSPGSGISATEVGVTLMVLPKVAGQIELPHSAFDQYMNGNCKVCHLPDNVMPSPDFLMKPEFCTSLCHNPSGMAQDVLPRPGGHPVLVPAGQGGTKMPTHGTVASGQKSDRMDTHLKDGRLITCVTCHNVMEKPGEYPRSWEMASSSERVTYSLYGGGWENMGAIEPRVYVTPKLMKMPEHLQDARKYLVAPSAYTYDEEEGTITFKKPRGKFDTVFVTLTNPYLRVTTEQNALCYDCHNENTHQGLNCLSCHQVHGGGNIKAIRGYVRLPGMEPMRVIFRATAGKGSFADGDSVYDGICEVCHTRTKYHRAGGGQLRHADGKDYSGTDCTRCHTHKNGFGV